MTGTVRSDLCHGAAGGGHEADDSDSDEGNFAAEGGEENCAGGEGDRAMVIILSMGV